MRSLWTAHTTIFPYAVRFARCEFAIKQRHHFAAMAQTRANEITAPTAEAAWHAFDAD